VPVSVSGVAPLRSAGDEMPASGEVGGPEYFTPEEFADLVQLSTKTVYRLAKEDPGLPVLRLGRAVRFPKARLLKWLRAREQGFGRARTRDEAAHG
jgi:excisionase family DNA binding protein